jgi:thiosulfate/3-mercaptopyruvate sulfurtransferase
MKKNLVKLGLITVSVAMVFGLTACQKTTVPTTTTETTTEVPAETMATKAIEEAATVNYVNAQALQASLANVVVIDARAEKEYKNGHIPGAVNITWQMLSNMTPKQSEIGWGVVLGKDELAKKIGSFGIDGSKDIVVYNDPKGLGEEGRVLWMLRIAGLSNTKMLNGGYPAWLELKGETTKEATVVTPVTFAIATYDESKIATTEEVKAKLGKAKILDTRSPEEFKGESNHGENYKGEKALGHIPGAIHMQYSELYNVDGTIKSVADIKTMMDGLGIKPEDEIITYCTVGIRSGFAAEILKMAGYNNVKNYNASFSEWAGTGNTYEK